MLNLFPLLRIQSFFQVSIHSAPYLISFRQANSFIYIIHVCTCVRAMRIKKGMEDVELLMYNMYDAFMITHTLY